MTRSLILTVMAATLVGTIFVGCQSPAGTTTPGAPTEQTVTTAQPVAAATDGTGDTAAAPPRADEPQRTTEAGLLSVQEATYDFGEVDPREGVRGQFILVNEGSKALTIDPVNIHKDCGCTVPELQKTRLEPGETAELTFSFHSPASPGPVTKKVWLSPDPPAQPARLDLRITANVRQFITVTPDKFELPLQADREPTELSITVKSLDGNAFQVLGVLGPAVGLTHVVDNDKPATEHVVTITADPETMPRSDRGMLRFRLNHPKVEEVYAQYNVVLPFTTYPTVRRFLDVNSGQTEEATVDVVSNFGQEFSLGDVTSEQGLVQVLEKTKRDDGWRLRIRMKVPADSNLKRFRDYLVVPIEGHPQDTMRVLCYCLL